MPKLSRSLIYSAATVSRGAYGAAAQQASSVGSASDTFWQRLAAAAAAAVHTGGAPVAGQQCSLHSQSGPEKQLLSPCGAARSAPALSSPTAQQPHPQQRGFATRATKASRSSGKAAQQAKNAADEQAAVQGAAKQKPTGPTAADIAAAERARRLWHCEKPVSELSEADIGKFVEVGGSSIPEAFPEYYAEAASRGETYVLKGGCKGLQEEVAATGTQLVLYRRFMHDLIQTVAGRARPQLYLDGPMGSGKSVALAALADWGRASGWTVVYIPSAAIFMDGGFFHKNEEGTWDTPDAAKLLMRTVLGAHETALGALPAASADGSLADLVAAGNASTDPHVATAAAVELLQVLKTQTEVPILFVVDDWNALYWVTGYHEWLGTGFKKRRILPTELRLANALKTLLDGPPPAGGVVAAAVTHSAKISTQLVIPRPKRSLLQAPRLDERELAAWLAQQTRLGALPPAGDVAVAATAMFHLTGGNAHELRRVGAGLLY